MKTLFLILLVIIAVVALSSADTVNFDNFKTGAARPGWTATQTGQRLREMVCRERRFGTEQAERVKTIRPGNISCLHQERRTSKTVSLK
jgi:hypothetical protein